MAKLNIPTQRIPSVADAYNDLIGINSENTIVALPINLLDIIEDQPFPINDEKILQIAESIESVGILEPLIVRKKDNNRYDILSGRHRFMACEQLNMKEIPCFIRSNLSDDMARFILIATNTDRNNEYPPSVYARAYKEQTELYKKLGKNLKDLADEQGTNRKQIYRYLRLNCLIPDFLDMVDSEEIAFLAGVELSYFDEDSQKALLKFSTDTSTKLKLDFIKDLRRFSSTIDVDILNEFCGLSQCAATAAETAIETQDSFDTEKNPQEDFPKPESQLTPFKNKSNKDESDFDEENLFDDTDLADDADDIAENVTELEELPQKKVQKSVNTTMDMLDKSHDEINDMCDSGMFNSIIEGYILLAFDEMNISPNINLTTLFDTYSAEDARKRVRT